MAETQSQPIMKPESGMQVLETSKKDAAYYESALSRLETLQDQVKSFLSSYSLTSINYSNQHLHIPPTSLYLAQKLTA